MTKVGYFRLGLFVLGAIAIAVAFILALGASDWFRPTVTIETYFNESVQGIDLGSKVKYRGVTIGQVSHIGFTYTRYELDKPMVNRHQYVLVEAQIQPEDLSGKKASFDPAELDAFIQRGLRVTMAAQGLTGAYYLEVDFLDPKLNPPLPLDWTPENPYIPSARSPVGQIMSGAENLMRKLDRANLDEVVINLNKLLIDLTRNLDEVKAGQLSTNADALISEVRQTNRELQAILSDPAWRAIPKDVASTLAAARKLVQSNEIPLTFARARQTLEAIDRAVAHLDRALTTRQADLPIILDNLRQTTENLRDLTEELRRYPAAAVFGAPPKPLERSEPKRKP